jgi:hypothetical protein
MYEAAASCKDIALAAVTNWGPQCVTLAGYCYAVRHGIKVHLVTPYRVSHLQRYGITASGNVTSVYPSLIRIYRTGVPLPSRCCILYIFSTNISTEYFKHAAHSVFLFKMSFIS